MRHPRPLPRRTALLALLMALALAAALLPAAPARAIGASITVKTSAGDKTNDDSACSLREALQALVQPSNDDCGGLLSAPLLISFDAPGTIQLKSGVLPYISKNVTITGPVIIDGANGSGGNDNILVIASDGTLNLANLTLTNGKRAITVNGGTLNAAGVSFLSNSQDGTGGGAIYSSGKVNIAGSLFTANKAPGATGSGGAIVAAGSDPMTIAGTIFSGNTAKNSGGAIYATTKLTLIDTIFNGNIAEGDDGDDDSWDEGGGAVFFRVNNNQNEMTVTRAVLNGNLSPKGSGGGFFLGSDAQVTVRDSALNGNLAGTPSNDRSGGALYNTGVLTLTHSTLLNNGVVGDGGAIANDRRGTLNISNSTLVANAASGRGAGIATLNSQTGSDIRPRTTALNVTLALNAAQGSGGGLYSQAPTSSHPQVSLLGNTIVSGSVGGNCGGSGYISLGHNLDSATSCGLSGAGDLATADAKLAAPAFNGGPLPTLLTMKLNPGSAALDAGDGTICAAEPVAAEDETGAARPQDGDGAGGAACDIGAYEGEAVFAGFGSDPVAPGPLLFGSSTVGASLPASVSVFNTGGAPLTVSAGSIGGVNAGDFALTSAFPFTIAAGGPAKPIGLTCAPAAVGPRSGVLSLSSNAPGAASISIELSCTGTPVPTAGFGADPSPPGPVSIGKVRLGESGSAPLKILEIGSAPLNVTNIQLGGLNPGDFSLSSAASIAIANGGGPASIAVSCTPTALGQRSASLTMQTNDPGQASVSFALSCTGAPAPALVVEATGTAVATADGPYGVTVSPDGANVYVNNESAGSLVRYQRDADGYPANGIGYLDGLSGGPTLASTNLSVLSPDGKFLYAGSYGDDAINVYGRDPSTGNLTYLDVGAHFDDTYGFLCFPTPCSLPKVKNLNGAYGIALSPDGKYLYVSGVISRGILVLARNPDSGSLRNASFPTRPAVVQDYIDTTNLTDAYGIAISPDGKHLYATAYSGGSSTNSRLLVFARNPSNGQISPVSGGVYKSGDASLGGLRGVFRVALSPDGNFVYAASYEGSSVMAFRRDPSTGKLSRVASYTNGQGGLSGLGTVTSVAVSPDGQYLFATAIGSGALSIFQRDQASGELDQVQVISPPSIAGARDVAVAPDGRMVFVSGNFTDKVVGFALANPVPLLSSLEPASAEAGSGQITLTVKGEGFSPKTVATWGGQDLATTFVSAGELQATVAASRLAAAGTAQVGARNPAPGGGSSPTTLPFTITAPNANPVPSLSEISPAGALAGGPALVVTITGAGFLNSSQALWNGAARPTSYVNGGLLQVELSAADLAQPGSSGLAVRNPAPGGGNSNSLGFEVAAPGVNPPPAISGLSPLSANAGAVSGELLVTVSGVNFLPGSQARWNGADRPTSYVSPTQLKVAIGAADLLTVGTASVDVVNPEPGGGPSNVLGFVIGASGDNPVPAATRASLAASGGALKITITGQGFVAGAKVRWNGVLYTPSSITSTKISFTVSAAALRTATAQVVNPGPGGGGSNDLLVSVRRLVAPMVRR